MPLEGYLFLPVWMACVVFGIYQSYQKMNNNTECNRVSLIRYIMGDDLI